MPVVLGPDNFNKKQEDRIRFVQSTIDKSEDNEISIFELE